MNPYRSRPPRPGLALAAALVLSANALGAGLEFEVDHTKYPMLRYPETAGTTKKPVVVLLHGVDGLNGVSGPQIKGFAEELATAGYVVFVPSYLDPDAAPPGAFPPSDVIAARIARLRDYGRRVAKAVDVARAQPDADKDRVGLVGFSLGGGLAMERAEASTGEIKAVVDFFGYIGSEDIIKGANKLPPAAVLHNPKDGIVKASGHSKRILDALDQTAVVHDSHFLHDDNPMLHHHPFLPGGPADKLSRELTLKWLRRFLQP